MQRCKSLAGLSDCLTAFSIVGIMWMFHFFGEDRELMNLCLFLTMGLLVINFVIIYLLQDGNINKAVNLMEQLTESLAVDLSAINTNHPVVNAVLNHKFHTAKEKQIAMIFQVGGVHWTEKCGSSSRKV